MFYQCKALPEYYKLDFIMAVNTLDTSAKLHFIQYHNSLYTNQTGCDPYYALHVPLLLPVMCNVSLELSMNLATWLYIVLNMAMFNLL